MRELNKLLSAFPTKGRQSFDDMVQDVMETEEVQAIRQQHPEIETIHIMRSLSRVRQAVDEAISCRSCPGLAACPNLLQGHRAMLDWTGRSLEVRHTACKLYTIEQEQQERSKLIRTHHIPREILGASFTELDRDQERIDAFRAIVSFCMDVKPGKEGTKGLYFYGPFGVGKSYMMAAAARKLAERGLASLMVYTPDFFREIKDALQDNTVAEKIQVLKEVPVLILDDIGAETLSPWARDEILGAILQYRVSENLPVLYTSNYTLDQLEEHLAYSQKAGVEQLKAMRIMERIRYYTDAYRVDGRNRRLSRSEKKN